MLLALDLLIPLQVHVDIAHALHLKHCSLTSYYLGRQQPLLSSCVGVLAWILDFLMYTRFCVRPKVTRPKFSRTNANEDRPSPLISLWWWELEMWWGPISAAQPPPFTSVCSDRHMWLCYLTVLS